jgi:hypothetical protein
LPLQTKGKTPIFRALQNSPHINLKLQTMPHRHQSFRGSGTKQAPLLFPKHIREDFRNEWQSTVQKTPLIREVFFIIQLPVLS